MHPASALRHSPPITTNSSEGFSMRMCGTNTPLLRVAVMVAMTIVGSVRAEEFPVWAARQTDGGPVRIAVAPPKDPRFAHLAWPKAIRTKDGTIVVAYLAGVSHGGSGCPAVSTSTDGGKTFTEPSVLRE